MKTFKLGAFASLLLVAAVITSCKKNGTNPASASAPQMAFQLKAVNPSVTLAAAPHTGSLTTNSLASSSVTWTSGIANISRFKLEAKMNGTEIEVTSHNLANVDLFAISPSITAVTLNPGTYTEIEVRVVLAHSSNPDSIPLKLKGTFASAGGTSIPVEFDFNDDAIVKAEAENVVVTTGIDYTSLVQMHLDKLLAGITAADLDNATQTGGTIIISSTSNTDLYNRIKDNLGSSCDHQFREHHHGDGNEDGNNNNNDGGNHN